MIALALFAVLSPLTRAHAHNDYAHQRPLLGALKYGFCSVEADVFLVGDSLVVAHDRTYLSPSHTLESMYLAPLARVIERHGGTVYGTRDPFVVLIDIKEDGEAVYPVLAKLLEPYRRFLTRYRNGKVEPGAVTIILSGDRPIATLAKQPERWCFIDGRPGENAPGSTDPKLTPWVSADWNAKFHWTGSGKMPEAERSALRTLVATTHRHGQKLRFWGTRDWTEVWRALWDADVDLIGTDRIPDLALFMRMWRGGALSADDHLIEPMATFAPSMILLWRFSNEKGFHLNRTTGGDRDHRDPRRDPVSRLLKGEGSR